jgi:hypothetical protein
MGGPLWSVRFHVVTRRRCSYLFPVLFFVALRALAHSNPAPLPWSTGVFDGQGLDDVLQTIRIPYARSAEVHHVSPAMLARPTGRVVHAEPAPLREVWLATAHPRAPPPA